MFASLTVQHRNIVYIVLELWNNFQNWIIYLQNVINHCVVDYIEFSKLKQIIYYLHAAMWTFVIYLQFKKSDFRTLRTNMFGVYEYGMY